MSTNLATLSKRDYTCVCDSRKYYGKNCELMIDICQNETCSMNGHCKNENDSTVCHCYDNFYGKRCEMKTEKLKRTEIVISTASILAIIIIFMFLATFILFDFHSWLIGRRRLQKRTGSSRKSSVFVVKKRYIYYNF